MTLFLPSFSLSILYLYQNTLRNFSTSVEIPSDRWPYNLTPSYPCYEHVSTIRSRRRIHDICIHFYLESKRGEVSSLYNIVENIGRTCHVATIFDQRTPSQRFERRSTGRCMHFRYAYNGHAFDDHVKESDNRLSIGVNGFRVWWYGVENSRREFSSVSRTRRV